MKVKNYDLCFYKEVWLILEYRDGCIYENKNTGKYIHMDDESKLPKDAYAISISTKLLKEDEVDLTMFEL